ncbi:hypothetical protein L0G78_14610, partial [Pseudomonas aeruginosa]|uniref:hypothetical protein n=1 Tax=Pseudomonas aeruginosa TaxID=287 RepID=UPI001F46788E
MQLTLPRHTLVVLLAVYIGGCTALSVDTVILDIDTLLGQIEIRLVLAIKGAGCLVLVSRLILVGDACSGLLI